MVRVESDLCGELAHCKRVNGSKRHCEGRRGVGDVVRECARPAADARRTRLSGGPCRGGANSTAHNEPHLSSADRVERVRAIECWRIPAAWIAVLCTICESIFRYPDRRTDDAIRTAPRYLVVGRGAVGSRVCLRSHM